VIPDTDHPSDRIERRRKELGVDALLVLHQPDLRWATGFTGSNGLLLWSADGRHFVTDGRYAEQATAQVRGADVHVPGYDLVGFLRQAGLTAGLGRIAFDSSLTSVSSHEGLLREFPEVHWVASSGLFVDARARKTDQEVEAIRRAQSLAERVFLDVSRDVRVGMTEREIAADLTFRCLRGGAEVMSFEPIVAFAERSALPHARPTDRVLSRGEVVLVDFGCVVDGYASDMTRMLSVGRPPDEVDRMHALVARAVDAAEETAAAGVPASAVDAAARRVIDEAGYGPQFPHSLGHGVGLDVHEAPAVSWRNSDPLPEGCVITIEPGVYLPGRFGIRIEDMVRVSVSGSERLTSLDRSLLVI